MITVSDQSGFQSLFFVNTSKPRLQICDTPIESLKNNVHLKKTRTAKAQLTWTSEMR